MSKYEGLKPGHPLLTNRNYDGDALHGDVVRRNFKSWKDDPSYDYRDDLFDKTYLGLPNEEISSKHREIDYLFFLTRQINLTLQMGGAPAWPARRRPVIRFFDEGACLSSLSDE